LPGPPYIVPADDALTAFTDGASLLRPRRGGIGIHFVHCDSIGNETFFDLDESGYAGETNNRMELQAVITALKAILVGRVPAHMLDGITKIDICTDSMYVVSNLNSAIYDWPSNSWMTRAGGPVLNADLWKELVRQYKKLKQTTRVELKWGKGHSATNPHNKTADKLAKQSARRATRTLGRPVAVRRKKSPMSTQQGSVEMRGQRMTIRIITAEFLEIQHVNRYRYEVMSRRSPFFRCVDFAFSDNPLLRPGHTYYVTMGHDSGYPQIAKCHREMIGTTVSA
jgi:ribonuclease HI